MSLNGVIFEGADGAGKTTLANDLWKALLRLSKARSRVKMNPDSLQNWSNMQQVLKVMCEGHQIIDRLFDSQSVYQYFYHNREFYSEYEFKFLCNAQSQCGYATVFVVSDDSLIRERVAADSGEYVKPLESVEIQKHYKQHFIHEKHHRRIIQVSGSMSAVERKAWAIKLAEELEL